MTKKPLSTGRAILYTVGLFFILIFLIRSCRSGDVDTRTEVAADTPITDSSKQIEQKKWEYSDDVDKMTSKTKFYATLEANDLLEFKSPYEGGSVATLTIRNIDGGNDILLGVSKGQLLTRSYESSFYKVRFDDNPATEYQFRSPSDGSSNLVFINNSNKFIKSLKKSKKLLIEIEFYQEGSRQIEFNTAGFTWDH